MVLSVGYIKEKWRHAGFQKYLRNTGWMFFGRFFALGVSFFVGAYIARYLGPANYGLMNYAISFVGLFGFLASFGIDGIVSREIITRHEDKDKLIGTAFFLKIIGSVLTVVAILVTAVLTTDDRFTFLLIVLFSLSYIPQAFNILETYFQSQVLSKNVVRAQIFSTIIATILKLGVIWLNKGIFWLLFIYIIEASLLALFLLITFKYYGHHFKTWRFDKVTAKDLLKDSWPLMLASVSGYIYLRIDQVMVKNILGNEYAGIFSAGVKLSEIWYLIPTITCASVFPSIFKSREINTEKYTAKLRLLYFSMFWLSVIVIIFSNTLSNKIVTFLYGNSYTEASSILNIYVISCLPVFIWTVINQFLLSENYVRLMLYQSITVAFMNIILNFILIPLHGISGAAFATVISYFIGLIFYVFNKKTRCQIKLLTSAIILKKNDNS